jgi:hypothetical protein
MKPYFISLLALLLLTCSGCNVLKHSQKTTTDVKTQEKQHSNTVINETITETTNTVAHVPSDSAKGSKPLSAVLKDSSMTVDNGNIKGTLNIDKNGNVNLHVFNKPQNIPVQGTKTTTRQTTIDTNAQKQSETEESVKNVELERKWFQWSFLWWLLLPAGIYIAYRIYRVIN